MIWIINICLDVTRCYLYGLTHVVRSVTKSNEFPQKRDQWKMYRTYMYFKGLYSLKSFTMGFQYFCPKNGSKRPINGPKMSWFGLVWFGLARL